jgi:metal-responsive CopG/Arc/MetJ family transcriptional regulator
MKAIQITVDERLLARLDAEPDVKRMGRSAIFRLALDTYLRQRRKRSLADAYRRAYRRSTRPPRELVSWAEEGVWPEP